MKVIEKQYPFSATDVMALLNITDSSKLSLIEDLIKQACEFIEGICGYSVTNEIREYELINDGDTITLEKVPSGYEIDKAIKIDSLTYILTSEKVRFNFEAKDSLKTFIIEYVYNVLTNQSIDSLKEKLITYKLRRV